MNHPSAALLLCLLAALFSHAAAGAEVTISFDGAEAAPGTGAFAHAGSAWKGGRIETGSAAGLHASGAFYYAAQGQGAEVRFQSPASDVRLFYVHGFGHAPGRATAYAADGSELGTLESRQATYLADPENFAAFDTAVPIARIAFSGGVVDSVSYSHTGEGVTVSSAMNGSWVNSSHAPFLDGQGLLMEYVATRSLLFAAWFSYDEAGRQRWWSAQGPVEGDTATLEVMASSGGRFNQPGAVVRESLGTMTIQFGACDRATVQLALPEVTGGSQSFEITRLQRLAIEEFECE